MKKHSDSFTQGGQTELHKFHMMRQVFGTTLKICGVLGMVSFILLLFNNHIWQDYYFLAAYYKALGRAQLNFLPKEFFDTTWIIVNTDQWIEVADHFLVTEARYQRFVTHLNSHIVKSLFQSLWIFIISIFIISGFWIWRGKKRQETQIIKGFELINPNLLKKFIKKEALSDMKINDIPMPFGTECQHMMITGTTGSGKSNAMHSLLLQIRELGHKAIVLDTTGELVSRFYTPETDHILNPLDKRARLWNLWKECAKKSDFEEMAEFLIPENSSYEPIWTTGPRSAFSECAKIISAEENPSISKLIDILLKSPLNETINFLKGTLAATMVDPKIEKASLSIRMILASALQSLECLDDNHADFSINHWMHHSTNASWMFLSCLTDQRALLTPLLSLWLSISVKSLMKMKTNRNRRVWFIIDELGTLRKLPILLAALAEARKYGGCFVIGFQDIWQLEEIYGKNIVHSLSGLTGTKLIFRTACATTAERMSKTLGEQEISEASESISYGAHQMREGVNLSERRIEKPVISSSDIMQLKNLQAYLKLPGSFPITRIEFPFLELPRISEPCLEKDPSDSKNLVKQTSSILENTANQPTEKQDSSMNQKTIIETEIS